MVQYHSLWYSQWYMKIPFNTIGPLNANTCLNGILSGIWTYFSTINHNSLVFSMVFENTVEYHWTTHLYNMFQWYSQWYLNIPFNDISDFSGIHNGIWLYRWIPLDHSVKNMLICYSQWYLIIHFNKSGFSVIFNGISQYHAIPFDHSII